jgi:hypothetical protein
MNQIRETAEYKKKTEYRGKIGSYKLIRLVEIRETVKYI